MLMDKDWHLTETPQDEDDFFLLEAHSQTE